MTNPWPKRIGALALAAVVSCGGGTAALAATDGDLAAALSRAPALGRPLVILANDPGQGPADRAAARFLDSKRVKALADRTSLLLVDLSVSRNRATATRFHLGDTPLLICLTPHGVIASRDEKVGTADLVLRRVQEVLEQSPALDARLAALEAAAAAKPEDTAAQFELADFLIAHHNAVEAIPRLAALAHSPARTPDLRLRAWVDLVRAHFWIAEPEKGRFEALDMMATLGPAMPEARAAGGFVLGSQDAGTMRMARAREELESAVAAAPDSTYGKQAAEALAHLPAPTPPR